MSETAPPLKVLLMPPTQTDAPDHVVRSEDPPTVINVTDTDEPAVDADPAPTPIDGRHARSERSRQAMVDALLDLLREGNLRPSATQIADRAGVTQRTLFNQFGDMESLILACSMRQAQRVIEMLPEAGDGDLPQRVSTYCAGLAHMLEETMNVRWAVVTSTHANWNGDRVMQMAREFMRAHLASAFGADIASLSEEVQSEVLNAVEISLDPAAWRLLRVQHGMSYDEAKASVTRAVLSILRDAP